MSLLEQSGPNVISPPQQLASAKSQPKLAPSGGSKISVEVIDDHLEPGSPLEPKGGRLDGILRFVSGRRRSSPSSFLNLGFHAVDDGQNRPAPQSESHVVQGSLPASLREDAVETLQGRVITKTKRNWAIGSGLTYAAVAGGTIGGLAIGKAALITGAFTLVGGPVGTVIGIAICAGIAAGGAIAAYAGSKVGAKVGENKAEDLNYYGADVSAEMDRLIDESLARGELPEEFEAAFKDSCRNVGSWTKEQKLQLSKQDEKAVYEAMKAHLKDQLNYFKSGINTVDAKWMLDHFGVRMAAHLTDLARPANNVDANRRQTANDCVDFIRLLVRRQPPAGAREIARAQTQVLVGVSRHCGKTALSQQHAPDTWRRHFDSVWDLVRTDLKNAGLDKISGAAFSQGEPVRSLCVGAAMFDKSLPNPKGNPLHTTCSQRNRLLLQAIDEVRPDNVTSKGVELKFRELENANHWTAQDRSKQGEKVVVFETIDLAALNAALEYKYPGNAGF